MSKSYLPVFRPGDTVTFAVTTAVTAGQLVEVGTADRSVAPASAGSAKVVGVAGHDAAIGDLVTIEVGKPIHLLTADGSIARGARVAAAADGAVATVSEPGEGEAAPAVYGLALGSAVDGAAVEILQF